MTRSAVRIDDVTIKYKSSRKEIPDLLAVDGTSFEMSEGEFVALVGPSGCGKSSLLMAIAGLVPIDGGDITVARSAGKAGKAPFSVVFQQGRLLPWLTTKGNISLGLEASGVPRNRWNEITAREIKRVSLEGFENSYPTQLSGGMQQRVNLARALAVNPELLLLDEPFAALDALTREVMQLELLQIWNTERTTALFVTHQVDEAVYLADRVVVMTQRPAKVKTIIEVPFERPRSLELKRSVEFLKVTDEVWSHLDLGVQDDREVGGK